MKPKPPSDAEVSAILAREARQAMNNPKNTAIPTTDSVAEAQSRILLDTKDIRSHFAWLEDTLNDMDYAQEVGASNLGHVVAYSLDSPDKGRLYVSDEGGTSRRHYSEVPVGVLARALPTIRKIIASVKRESVVQGHTLEMHLQAYEAGR